MSEPRAPTAGMCVHSGGVLVGWLHAPCVHPAPPRPHAHTCTHAHELGCLEPVYMPSSRLAISSSWSTLRVYTVSSTPCPSSSSPSSSPSEYLTISGAVR